MKNILLIEESPDADYFVIQVEGKLEAGETEGLVLQMQEEEYVHTYTFTKEDELLDGVAISSTSIVGLDLFRDGIKHFTLFDGFGFAEENIIAQTSEGFAAVVTNKVMKEASLYKLEMDYRMKEAIWDKVVLLNNLSLAATAGSVNGFTQNLKMLERIL